MTDPNRWQPLQLEHMISQNGIPVVNGVQQAVGPHWGHVKGFALPAGRRQTARRSTRVRRRVSATRSRTRRTRTRRSRSSATAPRSTRPSATTIDISPGVRGDNALGTNDGTGHPVNPATGQPYAPDVVNAGRLRPGD